MKNINKLKTLRAKVSKQRKIKLYKFPIRAGFPSPAESYMATAININKLLIKHPRYTEFVVVNDWRQEEENIHSGDLAIVDKTIKSPVSGTLVYCKLDGEEYIKTIDYNMKNRGKLISSLDSFNPIEITEDSDFEILGAVIYTITSHIPLSAWSVSFKGSFDLNEKLITSEPSTFFAIIDGDSMIDGKIYDGDLAIIDKLFDYSTGLKVLCYVNNEFTVKYIELDKKNKDIIWLVPDNNNYPKIKINTEESELLVWGLITYTVTSHTGKKIG